MTNDLDRYFDWLCDLVGADDAPSFIYPRSSYRSLLLDLYLEDFRAMLPHDENRASEGLSLRDAFQEETGGHLELDYRRCSVLEMMIALAKRMSDEVADTRFNENLTSYFFWYMVENLGFLHFDDHEYNSEVYQVVAETLKNLVDRRYRRDGYGGLFPLKSPKNDQRYVEIWYQANAWLIENGFC